MENAKVYKIINDIDNKIYIGSSTFAYMSSRLHAHKSCSKDTSGRRESKLYIHMREIGHEHFKIEVIESVKCETKLQLKEREQYWIDMLNPELNMFRAIPDPNYKRRYNAELRKKYYEDHKETILDSIKKYREENKEIIKERKKLYREKNKESIKERKKLYREKNKESIKERKAKIITCECGSEHRHDAKANHLKTKKHQNFIESKS